MTYQIEFIVLIKTTGGKQFNRSELLEFIDKALWDIPEFRDIEIMSFTFDDPNEDI